MQSSVALEHMNVFLVKLQLQDWAFLWKCSLQMHGKQKL